jgi:transposase
MAASIKNLEAEIRSIIVKYSDLKNNYDLLITVPGIGHLTAVYLICCTNNFAGKISGKQLACYAGVVPFEHSSGISVKGRNKVHPMANKDLKKALHLCALTAIQYYPEFRQYYERKKAEGKHSMSVLNAIRNKIVLRAAAVVNNQKAYVDNTHQASSMKLYEKTFGEVITICPYFGKPPVVRSPLSGYVHQHTVSYYLGCVQEA